MKSRVPRRTILAATVACLLVLAVMSFLVLKVLWPNPASVTNSGTAPAPAVQAEIDNGPFPADTVLAMNDAWTKNDPSISVHIHLPGTPAEEEYSTAVHAVLGAQGRMVVAFKTKLDPNDITTLPPTAFYIKPLTPWHIQQMQVTRIDERTADVTIPYYPRYHLKLVDGQWRTDIQTTIASVYPTDPTKALQVLTRRFNEIAAGIDTTTGEIMSGTLTSSDAIVAAVTDRVNRANQIGTAEMPPYKEIAPPKTA